MVVLGKFGCMDTEYKVFGLDGCGMWFSTQPQQYWVSGKDGCAIGHVSWVYCHTSQCTCLRPYPPSAGAVAEDAVFSIGR